MTVYGYIQVLDYEDEPTSIFPLTSKVCSFGMDMECDIRILLKNVSKVQCFIKISKTGKAILEHTGEFPTLLNGNEMSAKEKVSLNENDEFSFEERKFIWKYPNLGLSSSPTSPETPYNIKNSRDFRKRKSDLNVNVINQKIQIVVKTPSGRIKTPRSASKRGSASTENDTPKSKKISSARKSNLQASFYLSPDIFDKTTTKKTPKKSLHKTSFILKETSTPKNKNLPQKLNNSQISSKIPIKRNLLMNKNLTTPTRIQASNNTSKKSFTSLMLKPPSSSKNETNAESNLQLEPSNKSLLSTGKKYSQGTKDPQSSTDKKKMTALMNGPRNRVLVYEKIKRSSLSSLNRPSLSKKRESNVQKKEMETLAKSSAKKSRRSSRNSNTCSFIQDISNLSFESILDSDDILDLSSSSNTPTTSIFSPLKEITPDKKTHKTPIHNSESKSTYKSILTDSTAKTPGITTKCVSFSRLVQNSHPGGIDYDLLESSSEYLNESQKSINHSTKSPKKNLKRNSKVKNTTINESNNLNLNEVDQIFLQSSIDTNGGTPRVKINKKFRTTPIVKRSSSRLSNLEGDEILPTTPKSPFNESIQETTPIIQKSPKNRFSNSKQLENTFSSRKSPRSQNTDLTSPVNGLIQETSPVFEKSMNELSNSKQLENTFSSRKSPRSQNTDLTSPVNDLIQETSPVFEKSMNELSNSKKLEKTSLRKSLKSPKSNLTSPVNDFIQEPTPITQKSFMNGLSNSKQLENTSLRKSLKSPKNDSTCSKKLFKTLIKQKSPKNDLTNIKGTKKLFASPKVQKSPKNDLSNIKGVKKLFASPKVQRSPRNDLTNIKGTKKLFSTPKVQKSPRNDLTNIKGTKKLFSTPKVQRSPRNDLTNITGIKDLFISPIMQNTPENKRKVSKVSSTNKISPNASSEIINLNVSSEKHKLHISQDKLKTDDLSESLENNFTTTENSQKKRTLRKRAGEKESTQESNNLESTEEQVNKQGKRSLRNKVEKENIKPPSPRQTRKNGKKITDTNEKSPPTKKKYSRRNLSPENVDEFATTTKTRRKIALNTQAQEVENEPVSPPKRRNARREKLEQETKISPKNERKNSKKTNEKIIDINEKSSPAKRKYPKRNLTQDNVEESAPPPKTRRKAALNSQAQNEIENEPIKTSPKRKNKRREQLEQEIDDNQQEENENKKTTASKARNTRKNKIVEEIIDDQIEENDNKNKATENSTKRRKNLRKIKNEEEIIDDHQIQENVNKNNAGENSTKSARNLRQRKNEEDKTNGNKTEENQIGKRSRKMTKEPIETETKKKDASPVKTRNLRKNNLEKLPSSPPISTKLRTRQFISPISTRLRTRQKK